MSSLNVGTGAVKRRLHHIYREMSPAFFALLLEIRKYSDTTDDNAHTLHGITYLAHADYSLARIGVKRQRRRSNSFALRTTLSIANQLVAGDISQAHEIVNTAVKRIEGGVISR